jgi:hypothetical protein
MRNCRFASVSFSLRNGGGGQVGGAVAGRFEHFKKAFGARRVPVRLAQFPA